MLNNHLMHSNHCPAGKYWSPGRPEDVPLQRSQDVPKRYYLTVPGRSQSDVPIWRPGDVPIWPPSDVLKWLSGDVLIQRSRDVPERLFRDVRRTFSGRPLKDLQSAQTWMSPHFFKIFFQNLFDWPNLSKGISTLKVYWEPSEFSKIEYFLQNWF